MRTPGTEYKGVMASTPVGLGKHNRKALDTGKIKEDFRPFSGRQDQMGELCRSFQESAVRSHLPGP